MNPPVTISVELPQEQAEALAQFVKRVGYQECHGLARNENEAYLMQYALAQLRFGLASVGYDPR